MEEQEETKQTTVYVHQASSMAYVGMAYGIEDAMVLEDGWRLRQRTRALEVVLRKDEIP